MGKPKAVKIKIIKVVIIATLALPLQWGCKSRNSDSSSRVRSGSGSGLVGNDLELKINNSDNSFVLDSSLTFEVTIDSSLYALTDVLLNVSTDSPTELQEISSDSNGNKAAAKLFTFDIIANTKNKYQDKPVYCLGKSQNLLATKGKVDCFYGTHENGEIKPYTEESSSEKIATFSTDLNNKLLFKNADIATAIKNTESDDAVASLSKSIISIVFNALNFMEAGPDFVVKDRDDTKITYSNEIVDKSYVYEWDHSKELNLDDDATNEEGASFKTKEKRILILSCENSLDSASYDKAKPFHENCSEGKIQLYMQAQITHEEVLEVEKNSSDEVTEKTVAVKDTLLSIQDSGKPCIFEKDANGRYKTASCSYLLGLYKIETLHYKKNDGNFVESTESVESKVTTDKAINLKFIGELSDANLLPFDGSLKGEAFGWTVDSSFTSGSGTYEFQTSGKDTLKGDL